MFGDVCDSGGRACGGQGSKRDRDGNMWSMKWRSPVPGKPVCAGVKGDKGAEKESAEALGPPALLFRSLQLTNGDPLFFFLTN